MSESGWGQVPQWGGQPPPFSNPSPAAGAALPYGYHAQPQWRPKPGIIPLRPISLGEIYDGSFQAIRTNPRAMLGISAAVQVIMTLLALIPIAVAFFAFAEPLRAIFAASDGATSTTNPFRDVSPGALVALGLSAFGYVVLALFSAQATVAMLSIAVSEAVLGRRVGAGELWRRTRRRLPAAMGLLLLTFAMTVAAILVLLLPGILVLVLGQDAGGAIGGLLLALGGIVAVVGAIFVGVKWQFALPVLLLEQAGVTTALRRSWRLVRQSWWRVFGIVLLTQLLIGVAGQVVQTPFGLIGGAIGGAAGQSGDGTLAGLIVIGVSLLGQLIVSVLTYPFTAAVTTLLYIDLRMRREGLDVELMRAVDGPGAV